MSSEREAELVEVAVDAMNAYGQVRDKDWSTVTTKLSTNLCAIFAGVAAMIDADAEDRQEERSLYDRIQEEKSQ